MKHILDNSKQRSTKHYLRHAYEQLLGRRPNMKTLALQRRTATRPDEAHRLKQFAAIDRGRKV